MEGLWWAVKVRRRLRMETVGRTALGDRSASAGGSGAIAGLLTGLEADIGIGTCESDTLCRCRTDGRISAALFVTQAEIFSLKEQAVQARCADLLFCCACRIFARGPFFGLSDVSKHTKSTAAKTGILAIGGLRAFFGADAVAAAGTFGDTSVSIDTTDVFVVDLSASFVRSSQLAFGFAVFFVGFDFGARNTCRAVRILTARQITSAFNHRFTATIETGPTGIVQGSAAIKRTGLARRNTMARCTDLARCTFRVFRARLPTDLLAILSLGLLDTGQPLFATCGGCGTIFAFFYTGSLLGVDLPSIGIFGDTLAYRTIADLRRRVTIEVGLALFGTLACLAIQSAVALFGAQQAIRIACASRPDIAQRNALSSFAECIVDFAIR